MHQKAEGTELLVRCEQQWESSTFQERLIPDFVGVNMTSSVSLSVSVLHGPPLSALPCVQHSKPSELQAPAQRWGGALRAFHVKPYHD
jgi:hypothetical protein